MKAYQVDFSNFSSKEWRALFEKIDENANVQLKLSHIKDNNARKTQAVSFLVKQYLLLLNGAKKIYYGKYGKPLVDKGKFKFNITHTGQFIFWAVDNSDVGIDAEIDSTLFTEFYHLFCTNSEVKLLDGYSEIEKNELLWKLWTYKEAYVKLLGVGLNLDLSSIQILNLLNIKNFMNRSFQYIEINGSPITFYSSKEKNYYMTICQNENSDNFGNDEAVSLEQISFEELFRNVFRK